MVHSHYHSLSHSLPLFLYAAKDKEISRQYKREIPKIKKKATRKWGQWNLSLGEWVKKRTVKISIPKEKYIKDGGAPEA